MSSNGRRNADEGRVSSCLNEDDVQINGFVMTKERRNSQTMKPQKTKSQTVRPDARRHDQKPRPTGGNEDERRTTANHWLWCPMNARRLGHDGAALTWYFPRNAVQLQLLPFWVCYVRRLRNAIRGRRNCRDGTKPQTGELRAEFRCFPIPRRAYDSETYDVTKLARAVNEREM